MSIYEKSQPSAIDDFRAATERKTMPGVTQPTFRCRKCGENKRNAGRKPVTPGYGKDGYLCAACAKGTA